MASKDKDSGIMSGIREWLLQAVERGIPVYTEGLRLLYEGLNQVWYHNKKADSKVGEALKKISPYIEVYDCSQETTTFTGTSPMEPRPLRRHRLKNTGPALLRSDDEKKDESGMTSSQEMVPA